MESAAKSVNWMDAIVGIQRLSLVTTNGFGISAGCFSRTRCNAVNGNQNNNNLTAQDKFSLTVNFLLLLLSCKTYQSGAEWRHTICLSVCLLLQKLLRLETDA